MSLNHRCDVTHSYVWLDAPMCVNDSLICVNDTLMCVNDSLICVYDSLICVYDSLTCVYDSLICVTWRVHGYHVTQSYVWRDSRIRVTKTHTGWRRPIACLKLRVSFRKRATNYRALLRKMTFTDKASYGSWPPCMCNLTWLFHSCHVTVSYVWRDSLIHVTKLTHMCQWLTHMCQRLTHMCQQLTHMCVRLTHMCDVTCAWLSCDTMLRVTWLTYTCD